jgi:type VI secretion system protein ImpC
MPERIGEDTPFRIAIFGDFSGRANRRVAGGPGLHGRKPILIDIDNFDAVVARMHAGLELPGPDEPIQLRFESLDDFHPEALYRDVPLFGELRHRRERALEQPAPPRPAAARRAVEDPLPAALESGSLLDAIVSGAEAPAPARQRVVDPWQQVVDNIVAPHLKPKPGARQSDMAAQVDEVMSLTLRVLLHHPDFQQLEAAWRSVDFLLRRLESGAGVQICLIDVSKEELLQDVATGQLRASGLYRILVEEAAGTVGGIPWAVAAGLYTFDANPDEIRALGAIGRIARQAGAPFLASISPAVMGCDSFGVHPDPDDWDTALPADAAQEWEKLRDLPEAPWIGLVLPRFLARAPYGKDAIEQFAFTEISSPPDHEDFLWGNSAVPVLYLIADSFLEDGWDVSLRSTGISGMPFHTYKVDGEALMTPCAECWMGQRTAEKFLDRGIMPLASVKNSDTVKLIRLQSVGRPDSRLRARWNQ